MRAGSAEEFGDGGDYGLLLVFAEFGEDRQGEDFAGGALGLGEVALGVAEGLEGLLQVKRDGVVDLRADFAGGEEFAQGVAASGADDVLVPDVTAAGNFLRKDDAVDGIRAGLRRVPRRERGRGSAARLCGEPGSSRQCI